MLVLKVKIISLPYILYMFQVLCPTRPRYQAVSVYRTIGPLVSYLFDKKRSVTFAGAMWCSLSHKCNHDFSSAIIRRVSRPHL